MVNFQNFDPIWCGKVMKFRAVGSVAAVLVAVVIMLARPEGWKLPGWSLIFGIVGPAAIVAVYQSIYWDALAQRIERRIIHGKPKPDTRFPPNPLDKFFSDYEPDPTPFEYNILFVVLGISWVLFCASPLFIIAMSAKS